MIYLGGGTSAGMVAVSMPASGTVEMDKSQIGITPNLVLDASGVPQVSAAVSIPSGTLSQNYNTTSGAVSFSNKVTTKTITENGTYGPENGQIFNKVIVSVAGSSSGTVKAQAVTATPQANSQTITPGAGYDYLSSVTVNPVPLDSRNGQTFRSNVTVTAADGKWFKSFTIAVPNSGGGSGTSNIQISKTVDFTGDASSNYGPAIIKPDSGYDGMAEVVIDTTNLFAVLVDETDQEQANEYILSGVRGYQISEAHGAHALRPVYGSMTNHGAASATLNHTTKSYTIGKGYHNGLGSVTLGSNSTTPNITINGTVVTYDDNGNYYDSIIVNVPSAGTTLSLTNFTLSSNTESIFKTPNNNAPSRDFSIDSIIDGYTIKPPYKGNTGLSTRHDGIEYVVIPPLASWSNGNKLVDIRNFNLDDTSADDVLSGVPYYTPTVLGLEKRTGTMVNQGAVTKTFTSSNESYTIPAGYHNGAGKVSINLNLNAYYVGSEIPSATLGNDGDIYLKLG